MLDRLRRLFSRGAEPPPLADVSLRPIGIVRNRIKEPMSEGWALSLIHISEPTRPY